MSLQVKEKKVWSRTEREAWQLPRDLTVSQWADQNRVLDPLTSAESGQWSTGRTPYLREIMDAFSDPLVEDITIMSSTQIGKTETLLNMLGYAIDQDPAPAMLVMPRKEDIRDIVADRIIPMIKISPALAHHLTGYDDDLKQMKIRMDRMVVYCAGSNSPAGLAGKPIKYLLEDEIDKYPRFSGKEADPIKLARERTRTFWNKKIVKASTPTTRDGYIFREYERSDKRRFHVPCPHCGVYQALFFAQLKWPEAERDPDRIRVERMAWYECLECKGKILDIHKGKMLIGGCWVPEGAKISKDGAVEGSGSGSRRGYWLSCFYSPWITFSEIVAEFLLSKDNPETLMNFVNSWLAEVWEEKVEDSKEDNVKRHAAGYPAGIVPEQAQVLTGAVDVQKDHFYVGIRGWGYMEESWLIRIAQVESWEEVFSIMLNTVYVKENTLEKMKVRLCCFDTGFRTDEVYEFARRYREIIRPIKGQDHLTGVPFKTSKIDRNPKTGVMLPDSIQLYHIDTTFFKDKLARLSGIDSGKWHLPADLPDDYYTQFCAEHKIIIRDRKTGKTRQEWRKKSNHGKNNWWDIEVYNVAAAEMLHLSAMNPGKAVVYRPEPRREAPWMRKPRSSWIKR